MKLRCFTSFEVLSESYTSFFDLNAKTSFFYSRPWFETLARCTLDPDRETILYSLEEGGEPRAMLLGCSARNRGQRPRVVSSLSNFYSMEFAPLVNQGPKEQLPILEAFGRALGRERPYWDILRLGALDRDSLLFENLVEALRRSGWIVFTGCQFGNWYQSVEGSQYQDYRKQLPSGIRRLDRKFEESPDLQFRLITGSEGLDEAFQAYQCVYSSSWKEPEAYPRFMPELVRCAAAAGVLRLGVLYFQGRPVAAQIWLVGGGRATIYKIAYDHAHKKLGVGSMLSLRMFRHVIGSDKVKEIDYGSGDDPYKRIWTSHRRERWSLEAFNSRTAWGVCGAAIETAKKKVKQHLIGA